MKKILLVAIVAFSFNFAIAQSGNNQLGIGVDVNIPLGDFGDVMKTGFGGTAKFLYGIGTSGQLTLTSGYTVFKPKEELNGYDISTSIIPILAGYRHNFSGFYVEPQVGYGIYGSKVTYLGNEETDSQGAFTWAAGLGYAMAKGLDLGVRYQSASKDGENTDLFGISARWNFSLGSGSGSMQK